jgi:hypothetical protein
VKDARGHGSNGFGKRTAQPSVSNVEAVAALMHALKPPAPIHDSMSGNDLVRNMRGGPLSERGARVLTNDPIHFSYLKGRR